MARARGSRPVRADSADVANAIEGRMAEICRDLELQAKRMRELQEQANELRGVIHEWTGELDAVRLAVPVSRGVRR